MEEVCERENCKRALKRVKANKGSPGVDGMTVQELPGFLQQHWPAFREQLLNRTYQPQPVRRKEIDKPEEWTKPYGAGGKQNYPRGTEKARGSTPAHSDKAPELPGTSLGPPETLFLRQKVARVAVLGVRF